MKEVWGRVSGVDPMDTPRTLAVLLDLMGLVAVTRRRIEALEHVDKDTYLKPIKEIETAFAVTNLDTIWGSFKRHTSDATMVGLAFCSDTLSRVTPEDVLDEAILDELKHDVEAMIDDVDKADIVSTLKAVILDHLESIRRAVVEYKIRGTQGLRQALDSGIGSLLRQRDELKKTENQHVVTRLMNLFGKIDSYVGVGIAAQKLFGRVTDLLQIGG